MKTAEYIIEVSHLQKSFYKNGQQNEISNGINVTIAKGKFICV
ncbi:ABC-type lipoprotein export system ATPase subunit [Natronobacillus azotifigens]